LPPKIWKTFPLTCKAWDQEFVVFNSASGNTHLINPVTAKILSILGLRPISALELSRHIAAEMQLDTDEEIVQRVEVLLETLDHLGLIESLPQ
jgi:PqqD family protein of HPr-rel-A system